MNPLFLYIFFIIYFGLFQVEIKKAEPRDSNKMNDVGANQWGMNQSNHLAMGVCIIILLIQIFCLSFKVLIMFF